MILCLQKKLSAARELRMSKVEEPSTFMLLKLNSSGPLCSSVPGSTTSTSSELVPERSLTPSAVAKAKATNVARVISITFSLGIIILLVGGQAESVCRC